MTKKESEVLFSTCEDFEKRATEIRKEMEKEATDGRKGYLKGCAATYSENARMLRTILSVLKVT